MAKDNDLIISEWTKGISSSPHVGFGDMRNVDIFSSPGVLKINKMSVKKSGSTVTNLPLWIKVNPASTGQVFALDRGGQLYKSTDNGETWAAVAGETAGGVGQGFEFMGGYVIVARSTSLDVYNISGNSWTNSWKTIDADTIYHPMIRCLNDGKIYGGAGRYVFSIEELTTFDPTSAGTYTFTQQVLDLPANYRVKTLAELGEKLEIGTWMGSSIYDLRIADIFPWDRSSPSFETPIRMNDNGVNAMTNINNILHILPGIGGIISTSNGVQSAPIAQIPNSVMDIESGLHIEPYPGSIMNYKGRMFFGIGGGSGISVGGSGVWSVLPTSNGNHLNYEHQISTGNDGTSANLKIGALCPITRDTFLIGWNDDAVYGIDKVVNTSRYTSYAARVDSAFYRVGTQKIKKTFTQGEFQLDRPLIEGQGIKLSYRTSLSASFTAIGTYDFATLAGVASHSFTPNIPKTEFVQIRIELTTSSGTPELRTVTFR